MVVVPKKSLGQHWLSDKPTLSTIADLAELTKDDTVVEIGPGTGTLTAELLERAGKVIAIELDDSLVNKLAEQFSSDNFEIINADFLDFDLSKLPAKYKVVANVPYYITSKIVRKLMTGANKPSLTILLVQKEVAERLAAEPGDMSILALSAQVYAQVSLGPIVKPEFFTPPPKVDSQLVILKTLPQAKISDEKAFFRVVKAGFSAPRKKLRSSLSGGLAISKQDAEDFLTRSGINPSLRAEQLSTEDWSRLAQVVAS